MPVELKEIIEKVSALDVFEKRKVTDEYVEIVFYNKDVGKWNNLFTDILGPAIKPQGAKPAKDIKHLAEEYGGIYDNQTLFKKEFDDSSIIVMFWPWSNGVHTTLKIILLKK